MDGDLDAVRERGQFHSAGAAAVEQGVGDELGYDQDDGVGGFGRGRRYEGVEEDPGPPACAGDGYGGAGEALTFIVRIRPPWSLDRHCPVLLARCSFPEPRA
ncbi:hypothetical protein OG311_37130 [Streptomyces sp. NBC_01343]|nr:hypothetical protein OG311_37130 [Streptomyces sp. NBC_01343]